MAVDPETKEAMDDLLTNASEAAPGWAEDLLGYVEEELVPEAVEEMVKAGFDDADERDALKVVLTAKALYLAYREVLTDIQDVAVRAYVQGAIEKAGPVPLGDQPGTMAQNPMPPRGVVAPLVPPPAPVVGLPPSSPRGPVPPGPTVFTPPKIGRP